MSIIKPYYPISAWIQTCVQYASFCSCFHFNNIISLLCSVILNSVQKSCLIMMKFKGNRTSFSSFCIIFFMLCNFLTLIIFFTSSSKLYVQKKLHNIECMSYLTSACPHLFQFNYLICEKHICKSLQLSPIFSSFIQESSIYFLPIEYFFMP